MGSFGFWQPIIIFSLLNVILTSGLYITALSGQLSMATAALPATASRPCTSRSAGER